MIKTIVIVIGVLIAGVLIFASTQPDSFKVERTASIKAAPDKIFPLINDLKAWNAWSPWEKKDPAMKRTFSPTTAGQGATYGWEGNKEVGQGRMEITESSAPSKIIIKLNFLKPFEAQNTAEFTLKPSGDATDVTWAMYGPMPFISKVMCLFFSMDKMVGKDFEAGLANLKAAAEK
jgi:uncharacterized protein YndB with AHSA1/START domain